MNIVFPLRLISITENCCSFIYCIYRLYSSLVFNCEISHFPTNHALLYDWCSSHVEFMHSFANTWIKDTDMNWNCVINTFISAMIIIVHVYSVAFNCLFTIHTILRYVYWSKTWGTLTNNITRKYTCIGLWKEQKNKIEELEVEVITWLLHR